jgi:hypothetical protein
MCVMQPEFVVHIWVLHREAGFSESPVFRHSSFIIFLARAVPPSTNLPLFRPHARILPALHLEHAVKTAHSPPRSAFETGLTDLRYYPPWLQITCCWGAQAAAPVAQQPCLLSGMSGVRIG